MGTLLSCCCSTGKVVYYRTVAPRSDRSEGQWECRREVVRRNDVKVDHYTDVASAVHGENAVHHMSHLADTLCRSWNRRGASWVLIGAKRCLDGCALTLRLALKRAQPGETLLSVHCTENRHPGHLEDHEKSSDSRYDKRLPDYPPCDWTTMCRDLCHCVLHRSHWVAATLA